MSNLHNKSDMLADMTLCLISLPISALIIYALILGIGPIWLGDLNHALHQTYDSIGLHGSPYRFSWSWTTLFIAICGIPHATVVCAIIGFTRRRRLFIRDIIFRPAMLCRFVGVLSISFIVMLIVWRVAIAFVPDDLMTWSLPKRIAESRLYSSVTMISLVSFPYSLLCILLLHLLKEPLVTRTTVSTRVEGANRQTLWPAEPK